MGIVCFTLYTRNHKIVLGNVKERKMQLFTHKFTTALCAVHSHTYKATTNRASKRTAGYPAFSEMATWSSIR